MRHLSNQIKKLINLNIKISLISIITFYMSCNNGNKAKDNHDGAENIIPKVINVANDIEKIEPLNWWVGFKNQELQNL